MITSAIVVRRSSKRSLSIWFAWVDEMGNTAEKIFKSELTPEKEDGMQGIEQLVKEVGGNAYDIGVARLMFRLGGCRRLRKYISLLRAQRHGGGPAYLL